MQVENIYGKVIGELDIASRTDLQYANLQYANLQYADLRDANLRYADLRSADLRYANLRGANLQYANLRGADLRYADLRYADLRDANLRYANLRDADLRYADLRDANLRYANLRDANLRDANLRGANLRDANLRGADLRGAGYNVLSVLQAIWEGDISPGLCAVLMAFDRECHQHPEAFQAWANGGSCPLNTSNVHRALIFDEERKYYNHSLAAPSPWALWEMIAREFEIKI